MIQHKWANDICQRCGTKREYREKATYQRTMGVLRHGVWEDKHIYTYHMRYHYGDPHGFDRPDCQNLNQPSNG